MKRRINVYFLALSAVMLGTGLFFLSTLSALQSLKFFGNTHYYLFHQLMAVAVGLIMGLCAMKISLAFLKKISFFLLVTNVILLAVVFLPKIGTKFWGASRWISIGNATFQPSEFLKITVIIYLAAFLSERFSEHSHAGFFRGGKHGFKHLTKVFVPFLVIMAIIAALLLVQKDMSTLGIIVAAMIALYFAAGTPLWHTIVTVVSGAGLAAAMIVAAPYRLERLKTILHPESDPLGKGLQLKQSLIALGSGGFWGKGLGMSTQKFGFLPQTMSDSIFAILGEEVGILGCSIIVLLFVLFSYGCMWIAKHSTDKFSKLIAVGVSVWIGVQAFVNIASALGIFPLSGVPLPFFSYGGSHIIAELIAVGLLLNISKHRIS